MYIPPFIRRASGLVVPETDFANPLGRFGVCGAGKCCGSCAQCLGAIPRSWDIEVTGITEINGTCSAESCELLNGEYHIDNTPRNVSTTGPVGCCWERDIDPVCDCYSNIHVALLRYSGSAYIYLQVVFSDGDYFAPSGFFGSPACYLMAQVVPLPQVPTCSDIGTRVLTAYDHGGTLCHAPQWTASVTANM